MRAWLFAFVLVAGCKSSNGMSDMSTAEPDLQAAPLTLTVAGQPRPMRAWYSFDVVPLAEDPQEQGTYLVITAIDPVFACDGTFPDVDALSFRFGSRLPGTSTADVLARHGPDLANTSTGSGYVQIDADDDRLQGYDLDGGTVQAGPGGSVRGTARYRVGTIALDGEFTASRCAGLDFIVPG